MDCVDVISAIIDHIYALCTLCNAGSTAISTDSFRRLLKTYLHDTSACCALEVDNFMRYINLLTYLQPNN